MSRRRLGGWAALFVAAIVPIQVLVLVGTRGTEPGFVSTPFPAIEAVRAVSFAVAAWGLHEIYRDMDSRWAQVVLIFGLSASIPTVIVDGGVVAGWIGPAWVASDLDAWSTLLSNVLGGLWYVGGGLLLARSGGDVGRVGTAGQFGGFGAILAGVAVYLSGAGFDIGSAGRSFLQYAQLLSVFVVLFLVRIWRFAAFGRLPGPGLI